MKAEERELTMRSWLTAKIYLQLVLIRNYFPCLCFSLVVKGAAGFCMKDGNNTVCLKAFQLLVECEI